MSAGPEDCISAVGRWAGRQRASAHYIPHAKTIAFIAQIINLHNFSTTEDLLFLPIIMTADLCTSALICTITKHGSVFTHEETEAQRN